MGWPTASVDQLPSGNTARRFVAHFLTIHVSSSSSPHKTSTVNTFVEARFSFLFRCYLFYSAIAVVIKMFCAGSIINHLYVCFWGFWYQNPGSNCVFFVLMFISSNEFLYNFKLISILWDMRLSITCILYIMWHVYWAYM